MTTAETLGKRVNPLETTLKTNKNKNLSMRGTTPPDLEDTWEGGVGMGMAWHVSSTPIPLPGKEPTQSSIVTSASPALQLFSS